MKFINIALLVVLTSQMSLKSHQDISPLAGKIFGLDKIIREIPQVIGTVIEFSPRDLEFLIAHNTHVNYSIGEGNTFNTSSQSWEQKGAQRNEYGDYMFLIEYLLSISHHYTYENQRLTFSIAPNETTLLEFYEYLPITN